MTRAFRCSTPQPRPCAACGKDFVPGDWQALVALGPGDSEEDRQRAREGRPYNAVAAVVHWQCAGHDVADAEAYFDKHFPGWREEDSRRQP
jgi:hypothetical protein